MTERDTTEGFTLIELLVVMIIIGVLAAIAMPALLHTRQKGYVSEMTSDLRNAVTAEHAYSVDRGTFTTEPADLVSEGYRWSDGVTPVHVKLVAESFVACVKHDAVDDWLVYDGTDGTTTKSSSDCA